ncbi:MAG TPA: hypothetical protein VN457_08035, partial [Chlamydiales bacterium]|nr:hypothetical protein [Chlamydiales bacterium]
KASTTMDRQMSPAMTTPVIPAHCSIIAGKTDDSFRSFQSASLITLRVNGCTHITPKALNHLVACEKLTQLELVDATQFVQSVEGQFYLTNGAESAFRALMEKVSSLRVITCNEITCGRPPLVSGVHTPAIMYYTRSTSTGDRKESEDTTIDPSALSLSTTPP